MVTVGGVKRGRLEVGHDHVRRRPSGCLARIVSQQAR